MAEPVEWRPDGVPRSARFGDIYHSEAGAVAQARHVFLSGCELPAAWAGQTQWRILETGFGMGLSFLATWQAWREDVARPPLLHFVSVEAHPVSRDDLLRAAIAYPELAPLANQLADQWHGLLPGFHRLSFERGSVLLTLCIGDVQAMLRTQHFDADSVFLDGFSPDRNPQMWSPETLKSVSRFARRGTRIATWTVSRAVRDALATCGFRLRVAPGLPPKRDCLQGAFEPAWEIRRRRPMADETASTPGHCAIIGAGLAGAAVAASLARRGWKVTVFDAGLPAAGASGLPAGILAPHVSPDDAMLSRLTRAGIRITWQALDDLLVEGRAWHGCGVLERRSPDSARLPADWSADGPNESWRASPERLAACGLPVGAAAIWHERAGWVRPSHLVRAWLANPGIRVESGRLVARLLQHDSAVELRDADDTPMALADRVVIAAGHDSLRFAPRYPLQPVRGQIAWGPIRDAHALPPRPINGDGYFIALPDANDPIWVTGATFDRDACDTTPREGDTEDNARRLARLHPAAAEALAADFSTGRVQAWAGVRCASGDRRPLLGPVEPWSPGPPSIWLCTAMGSRGMSFAALCAELLAARWHGEPLPVPTSLAKAIDTRRI